VTLPAQGDADEIVVRDNPEQNRYEAFVGGALAGSAEYHAQPGLITVLHTETDPAFGGRGVGSALVRELLEDIRRRDAKVHPVCPFARAFLERHREYADLVWRP
jgi:predicted GNAT family acetyltransferase